VVFLLRGLAELIIPVGIILQRHFST